MAQNVTLYRFRLDVSDVDRGVYEQLDFRVAQHPSETLVYLLTRVLAYALNYDRDLQFSSEGLGNPDTPALSLTPPGNGGIELWIEIGNPSPRKLHKASKASQRVKVYTYKDPQLLIKECQSEHIHHADQIEIQSFNVEFLENLAREVQRDNRWSLLRHDNSLTITLADPAKAPLSVEILSHKIED